MEPLMTRRGFVQAGAAGAIGLASMPAWAQNAERKNDKKDVFGGFIVGVLENMVAFAGNQIEKATGVYIIGNGEKLTVALIIVIFVLTVKPAGLFGRVIVKRV